MIRFHYEDISFKLPNAIKTKAWLKEIAQTEDYSIKEINYIFCSDEYLLKVNIEHLNHNFFTDIITFDNTETPGFIESDIFISIDRVKENAKSFGQEFEIELKRVMAHGLLHLMGYKDKSPKEQAIMREKENFCLSLIK